MERSKSSKSKKRRHHRSHHSSSDEVSDNDSSQTTSTEDSSNESDTESSGSGSTEEDERPKSKKARRSSESERHGGRKHKKRKERESLKHKERRKSKDSTKRKKERRDSESKRKVKKTSKREKISVDDYFIKSAEFRTWLSNERGKYFNDLMSDESRKLFKKFVDKWNSGLLKKKYYKGIETASVGHDTQSQYKWKFASRIDSSELKTMRESVSSWTANTAKDEDGEHIGESSNRGGAVAAGGGDVREHLIGPQLPGQAQASPEATRGAMIGPTIGPRMGPFQGPSRREDAFEREERHETERVKLKKERKDLRKHQEMVLDELLPKATGREARIEKKRAKNQQRRAREASPDVADSTLLGSRANIKDKIRFRQEQRQHKAQAAAQKISDYATKEKARVAAILEMAKANKKEGAMW